MGLYDEVTVEKDNKVNIPPPKDVYQTNSLGCNLFGLHIDKEGYLRYDTEPDRVIEDISFSLYGEDETEYCRKYILSIIQNKIEVVWEIEDDGSHREIYMNPRIRASVNRLAQNMLPLHRRSPK
jgi:hypothetical protein